MRLKPWSGLGKWVMFLALMIAIGSMGCGSSTGNISGKVYYKNTPLKGGNVSFIGSDNTVSRLAEIQEDGGFRIDKMPVGEVVISVDTKSLRPPMGKVPLMAMPKSSEMPGGYNPPDFAARAKRYVPIPERYSDAAKSGLKYTVKAGSQDHDIKLE